MKGPASDDSLRCVLGLLADLPSGSRILILGDCDSSLEAALIDAGHDLVVRARGGTAGSCDRPSHARLHREQGELVPVPHAERAFEAVVAIGAIAGLERWGDLLAEMCRLARRAVIVDFPSSRSPQMLLGDEDATATRLTKAEVRDAVDLHGFRVVACRSRQLFSPSMHRRLGSPALAQALELPPRLLGLTRLLGSPVLLRADRHLVHERLPDAAAAKVELGEIASGAPVPEA